MSFWYKSAENCQCHINCSCQAERQGPSSSCLLVSLYDECVFRATANFGKTVPNDPNITLTYSRSNIQYVHFTPHNYCKRTIFYPEVDLSWGWNFHSFALIITRRFWVKAQFSEKCSGRCQDDIDIFSQKAPMYISHVLPIKAQIFLFYVQHSEKSALNNPTWSSHVQGQISSHSIYIHMHSPNILKAPIFPPFHSTMSRFRVTAVWPNSEKRAQNDFQMNLTCSRSKVPMCKWHTSLRPKFSSFSLYNEPFSRLLTFLNLPLSIN